MNREYHGNDNDPPIVGAYDTARLQHARTPPPSPSTTTINTNRNNFLIDSLLQRINEMEVLETMLHHRVGVLEGKICNDMREKAALVAENQRLKSKLDHYESSSTSHSAGMEDDIFASPARAASLVTARDYDDDDDDGGDMYETGVYSGVCSPIPSSIAVQYELDDYEYEYETTETTTTTTRSDDRESVEASDESYVVPHDYHRRHHHHQHYAATTDSDNGEDVREEESTYDYIPATLKSPTQRQRTVMLSCKEQHDMVASSSLEWGAACPASPPSRDSNNNSPSKPRLCCAQTVRLWQSTSGDIAQPPVPSSPPLTAQGHDNDEDNETCRDSERWIMKQHAYNLALLKSRRRDMRDWKLGNFDE